jgi:hypothetical protein
MPFCSGHSTCREFCPDVTVIRHQLARYRAAESPQFRAVAATQQFLPKEDDPRMIVCKWKATTSAASPLRNALAKMQQRVEYDLYYIDNWSFLFDVRIILMTLASKRAYTNAF